MGRNISQLGNVPTDKQLINKIPAYWYLFFFVVALFFVNAVVKVDDYDLHRYFDEAVRFAKTSSLLQMIKEVWSIEFDFIYYVILYFSVKLSISLKLVTALFVATYYWIILGVLKDDRKLINDRIVDFVILFVVPIIWVVSISRNLAAIVFLYAGVVSILKSKRINGILWLVIGVLTHFSVLMYVVVFVVSMLLRKIRIKPFFVVLFIAFFYILSQVIPDYLYNSIKLIATDRDLGYYTRFENVVSANVLEEGNWPVGDILSLIFVCVFSITVLLFNKKQGFEFWTLFILLIFLAFFVETSVMFVNRCMMIMPLFIGMNVLSIYKEGTNSQKKILKYLSYAGGLVFMLYIYTSRTIVFG